MITSDEIKELAAQLRRSERPVVAVIGEQAQIWTPAFVLEVPAQEVSEEVVEKYAGEPLDLTGKLTQEKFQPGDQQARNWRKYLFVENVPPEDTYALFDTMEAEGDPDAPPTEIQVLTIPTGEQRKVNAALYTFMKNQLLNAQFRFQPGLTYKGDPTNVMVFNGDDLVGGLAPIDVKKPDGTTVYTEPRAEQYAA